MVPWLLDRQGIDIQQAADDLGISVEQLEADLDLLFLCGYRQMPDELVEADWEGGKARRQRRHDPRPLRLGVDEAVTLIVGLRSLREAPGLAARDAVDRALAKLEDAAVRPPRPRAASGPRWPTGRRPRSSPAPERPSPTIAGCACALRPRP